jgi:hypothetical protein
MNALVNANEVAARKTLAVVCVPLRSPVKNLGLGVGRHCWNAGHGLWQVGQGKKVRRADSSGYSVTEPGGKARCCKRAPKLRLRRAVPVLRCPENPGHQGNNLTSNNRIR